MDVEKERKRYVTKLRALENKKLQLKQQFERIDHKLDVVDPLIEEAKSLSIDAIPKLELESGDDV